MSTTTPNLGLFKYDPSTDGAQTFNIKQGLNDNWDKIDAAVKSLSSAAEYSSAQTYALGDYCTHDGKLYRCTTAITEAEAWTEAHWTETSVTAELIAIYTALQNKPDKDRVVNPNLLDNWYFGNPVNQRGETKYTDCASRKYMIDRWMSNSEWGYVELNLSVLDGYCEISSVADTTYPQAFGAFNQCVPNPEELIGKTVTLSVLVKALTPTGEGYVPAIGIGNADGQTHRISSVDVTGPGLYTYTRVWESDDKSVAIHVHRGSLSTCAVDIVAWKLELGDQQTLAHQDADGNWVLNEIPDYGEQLARCQRYFQTFETESLRHTDALDFRPVMRTNPALSTITVGGKTLYTANADL